MGLAINRNNSLLYVADFTNGVAIFNINDPLNPAIINVLSWNSAFAQFPALSADEQTLFVANYN